MNRQFRAVKWTMFIGAEAGLTLVPDASMTSDTVAAPSCCMPGIPAMLLISCWAASGTANSSAIYKRILASRSSFKMVGGGCGPGSTHIRDAGRRFETMEKNR